MATVAMTEAIRSTSKDKLSEKLGSKSSHPQRCYIKLCFAYNIRNRQ